MIRVLFVCWGSIRRNLEKPRDFGTLRDVQKRFRPRLDHLKQKIYSLDFKWEPCSEKL